PISLSFSSQAYPPHHLPLLPPRRSSDLGRGGHLPRQVRPPSGRADADPEAAPRHRQRRRHRLKRRPRTSSGREVGSPKRGFSGPDRKSTRLNSSHVKISYAVFCLKKKKI